MKKNSARALAVAALVAVGALVGTAPAQAHYDPWTTHWHYDQYGRPTYKQCSVFDSWMGCKDEYRTYGPIVLR